MSVRSRRISVAAGFAALILGIGGAYLLYEMKQPPAKKPVADRTKVVDTLQVKTGTVSTSLNVQGELVAYDKIDLFAEVSGMLEETSRPFKVGSYFPKGTVLIRIDDEEARLNLLSQKSNLLNAITQMMPDLKVDHPESFPNWVAYLDEFELEGTLPELPEPVSRQEKFFVAARNIYSQFFSIRSAEERLTKYVLKAPFSGVLTQTNTNPGALVRVGQQLGVLMNTSRYELMATIPLSELEYVRTGSPVQLHSDALSGQWQGRVERINDRVDPGTQTVKIFVAVAGKGLREGMYLRGEVMGSMVENASLVPKELLLEQSRLFVIEDGNLQSREVEVVRLTTAGAIVRGLPDGTVLLAESLPGAFAGMPVRIRETDADAAAATTPAQNTISSTR